MRQDLADGALWYGVFVFSTVGHEAAHAWTAHRLGDSTAQRGGQVSLNPWPHIRREPFGMVVIPLLSWFLGGWLIGWASAPYDPEWARTYPRRAALMALAGPAANFLLVIAAGLLLRLGLEWGFFQGPFSLTSSQLVLSSSGAGAALAAKTLSVIFSLNLLLGVFNLLPLPPLDGSSLPLFVLPARAARGYLDALSSPAVRLIGLVLVSRGFGAFFPTILRTVAELLYC